MKKFWMNKRGDLHSSETGGLIFIAVCAVVLVGFMIYFSGILNSTSNKAACQNWVNMQTSLKFEGFKLASLKSPCITSEEVIKTSKRDEIYEQLARSMYDCWDMYGEGKKDFYSDWSIWNSVDKHCRICSEIRLDESLKDKDLDIDEFEIYLSTHSPPNHGEKYAEYFLGGDYSNIDFGSGKLKLSKDQPMYTIFFVVKGEAPTFGQELWEQIGRNLKGAGIGAGGFLILAGLSLVSAPITMPIIIATATAITSGTALTALTYATAIGVMSANAVEIGEKSYLYPSILLVSGDEIINKCKDDGDLYVKYENSLGDKILNKGENNG